MKSNDISRILGGWKFEPGKITVRRITGRDGRLKIQMRLDLGLLQMEIVGRPDDEQPFGFESLLHFHKNRLQEHILSNESDLGFAISAEECQALRDEAVMYYHRYLSLFVLEDFSGVARDTGRNIEVLDLCRKYAMEAEDRTALEPYRPYLIMMNTRACAHMAVRRGSFESALEIVNKGLDAISECCEETGVNDSDELLRELVILEALRVEIADRLPRDPADEVAVRLAEAIENERYEEAAALRDELRELRDDNEEAA